MAKKKTRRAEPAGQQIRMCPCGLGKPYAECCGVYHSRAETPPTAELLMRSRYSAFAVADTDYLLFSWHPSTRPPTLDLDRSVRWTALEILGTTAGGPFHTEGTVEFEAHYSEAGRPGVLHENSTFSRVEGRWVYVRAL